MRSRIKHFVIRFSSALIWGRNTEKAYAAAEQKAFNAVFESKSPISIKEWWGKWEWLFNAITIILGILYTLTHLS